MILATVYTDKEKWLDNTESYWENFYGDSM